MQSSYRVLKSTYNLRYSVINQVLTRGKIMRWEELPTVAMMSSSSGNSPPSSKDFEQLDKEKKRRVVEMELQVLRQTGEFFVPNGSISDSHWEELLTFNSVSRRTKFYKYLKKIEMAIEKKRVKSSKNEFKYEEKTLAIQSNPHLTYGLWRNSIMIRVTDKQMIRHYNNNLRHAVLFGQKFVVDMGYDQNMDTREKKAVCDQLQILYGANLKNRDPFHLHFCNIPSRDSELNRRTFMALPQLKKENGLTKVTEKSYLDLFDRKQLVYLTQDCREDLVRFNHDDIYIIAGLVELGDTRCLSRAKAKKDGLRMARLPFERYLNWGGGRSALCLNHMMNILLTVKNTGDWKAAFEHVPKRFIRQS